MSTERVMASVTLKSRSGLSAFKNMRSLSLSRIDEFRPKANHVDQVVNLLTQAGFTIEAQTEVGVSFSAPKDLFQSEFGVTIRQRTLQLRDHVIRPRQISFYQASQPLFMSPRIEPIAEAVQLAIPGIPFHNANPPAPNPNYYFLNVLNDVPARLNVAPLHAAGIRGNGVRISMVDTGFVTRVTETHVSTNPTQVVVDHTARHVQRESLFLRKIVLGIQAQAIGKNLTRLINAFGAPAVLLHSLHTQQGVCNIVFAMTRRDFVKPAFSLRKQRFVKTHALSLLGTKNLRFSAFRFHDFQRGSMARHRSWAHWHELL